MPTYNKLVRDKIPQIIENKGKEFSTKVLNDEDYIKYLKEKAYEELDGTVLPKQMEKLWKSLLIC
jgi:predicted house-cleaning noncanonical NTP pyrophosphatase (MazG superfamily)